jgi:hypothetical protein
VARPNRDNPIARRQLPKVNDYVGRLMDHLGIDQPQATGRTA